MSVHRNVTNLSEEAKLRARVAELVASLVCSAHFWHRQAMEDRRDSRERGDTCDQSARRCRARREAYMRSAREAWRTLRSDRSKTLTERRRAERVRLRYSALNPEVSNG